jgi:hypothetical protein
MLDDTLGAKIARLKYLKARKKILDNEIDEVVDHIEKIEADIIHMMSEQKVDVASHDGLTVRPKDHTYAHVEDWNKLYEFIEKEHYLHLLEKRVSVTGYRELLELGRQVPGVVPFVKTKLSISQSLR